MTGPRSLPEAHCRREGCRCVHDGCFKGWIARIVDGREVAVPCPNCRWDRQPSHRETDEEWKRRLREKDAKAARDHH